MSIAMRKMSLSWSLPSPCLRQQTCSVGDLSAFAKGMSVGRPLRSLNYITRPAEQNLTLGGRDPRTGRRAGMAVVPTRPTSA